MIIHGYSKDELKKLPDNKKIKLNKMENVAHSTETALQQSVVMRSVLVDLRNQLERSRQLTQSFDEGEARWRDGMEIGLETAIELLEDAMKKHFS